MLQPSPKLVSPWLDTSRLRDITDLLARDEGQVLDFKSARIELLDQALEFIATILREFTKLGPDGKFITTMEYPPFVWQEAVTNAVVHRS